jgi:hypothetical protein
MTTGMVIFAAAAIAHDRFGGKHDTLRLARPFSVFASLHKMQA